MATSWSQGLIKSNLNGFCVPNTALSKFGVISSKFCSLRKLPVAMSDFVAETYELKRLTGSDYYLDEVTISATELSLEVAPTTTVRRGRAMGKTYPSL